MAIQYHMRAYDTVGEFYVDWVVNDRPDTTGEFYPGGSANLANITINRVSDAKVPNRIKPLNSIDGRNFHLNDYDWLKSTRTSSDTDSATDPIAVPDTNVGLSVVRGTADGSTPRSFASLYWNENQGIFGLGFTASELETLVSTKPLLSGHINIVEGDEDGYISIKNNSKNPASVGVIRVPNLEAIVSNNNGGSANISMIFANALDQVEIGSVTYETYLPGEARIDGYIVFNTPSVAAQSGYIRSPNNVDLINIRNVGNTNDVLGMKLDDSDVLIIGNEYSSNLVLDTGGSVFSSKDGTSYFRTEFVSGNGAAVFLKDVANPSWTQDLNTSGNGQNMFVTSQASSVGNGGALVLGAGSGSSNDGYVDVRSGNVVKLRVYGDTVPVVSDYPLLSGENPGSVLLFNENMRFYDNGVSSGAIIIYDASSTHAGNVLSIKGQDSSTSNGGNLNLSSGTATVSGDNGDVNIFSGTVLKLNIEDTTNTTTTYNNNFIFDNTVLVPKIEHEYAGNSIGLDFLIRAQAGDDFGGKLLLASGQGATQPGDLHLMTGLLEGLIITQDGYGFTRSLNPGFLFGAGVYEDGYGTDKVLISQEDDASLNYVGTEMWLSAQSAQDGYGGNLVLSSGKGKIPLTNDGDLIFRIGHTPVEMISASAGYITHQFLSDVVQIDGDLIVNGTTSTINSTVVDIADRVIHVNHSTGINDPAPINITGLSVHRGAIAGVNRNHSGIIWDEVDNGGIWKLATINEGDDTTLVASQSLLGSFFLAQSSVDITELDVPSVGGFRTLNGTVALSSRNNASDADLSLVSTNSSDQVLYGDVNVSSHIFNTDVSGLYSFGFNSVNSVNLGDEFISIGLNPSISGTLRTAQTFNVFNNIITTRNIADDADRNIVGVDGYDRVIHGDGYVAGHEILSDDGYSVDIKFGINNIVAISSSVNRNIFNRGYRREITHLNSAHTILDNDGYFYIAVDSSGGTFTITLPSAPTEGDVYEFKDTGSALTNNWILDGNGNSIDGNANVTVSQSYVSMILTYVGGTINEWLVS